MLLLTEVISVADVAVTSVPAPPVPPLPPLLLSWPAPEDAVGPADEPMVVLVPFVAEVVAAVLLPPVVLAVSAAFGSVAGFDSPHASTNNSNPKKR